MAKRIAVVGGREVLQSVATMLRRCGSCNTPEWYATARAFLDGVDMPGTYDVVVFDPEYAQDGHRNIRDYGKTNPNAAFVAMHPQGDEEGGSYFDGRQLRKFFGAVCRGCEHWGGNGYGNYI